MLDTGAINEGDFELQPLVPTESAWDAGVREIYCVVDSVDGQNTGSLLLEG